MAATTDLRFRVRCNDSEVGVQSRTSRQLWK